MHFSRFRNFLGSLFCCFEIFRERQKALLDAPVRERERGKAFFLFSVRRGLTAPAGPLPYPPGVVQGLPSPIEAGKRGNMAMQAPPGAVYIP